MDSHVHLVALRDLHAALDSAGVDKAFVIPAIRRGLEKAATYSQLKRVISRQGAQLKEAVRPNNSLSIELARESGRLFPLAWINPLLKDAAKEANECLKKGAVGIKLQPGFHGYALKDECVARVVKTVEDHNAPIFVHTGTDVPPLSSRGLIEEFRDVPFVLMHMGMYTHYTDAIALAKKYDNVYVDTADPLPAIAVEMAFEQLGSRKILMGSDYPFWGHPKLAVDKIQIAVRDSRARRMILGKNALRLVGRDG